MSSALWTTPALDTLLGRPTEVLVSSNVEKAVDWIADGNVETFRGDFSTVEQQFPDLSDEDKEVLRVIHAKGLREWDEEQADVVGQGARSYGW